MIVLDTPLPTTFGNVTGKTYRVKVYPDWPASSRITKLRVRVKGHADEPLSISQLHVGRSGAGAATLDGAALTLGGQGSFVIPAGQEVDLDELTVDWVNPGPISFSGYGTGGPESDRLAASAMAAPNETFLKVGNFVMQADAAGFLAYPGYLSLVTRIECDSEAYVPPPDPEPTDYLRNLIFACLPMQVGDTIHVSPGVMAVSGGQPDDYLQFPTTKVLNINAIGKWGLTQAKPANGWIHLWACRDGATGEAFIIGDRQNADGSVDGFWNRIVAAVPTADRVRYMPAVFRIIGGHLEEQVVTCWPRPGEFWHQAAGSERTIGVNWSGWQAVGLQPRIPKEARLIWVETTGSVKVRTPGLGVGTQVPGLHAVFPSSTGVVEMQGTGSCIVRGWRIMDTY